jgi:hypothetical protein
LKKENEAMNETIEKNRKEIMSLNKFKQECYENDESTKRDNMKKMQNNLNNLAMLVSKMKNKYQQELLNLKSELDSIHLAYESEMNINLKTMKSTIEGLELTLYEEKMNNKKIMINIESKENEFTVVQKDIDKLKDMYENKIKLLNNKIGTDEENMLDLKTQIKTKTDVIYI